MDYTELHKHAEAISGILAAQDNPHIKVVIDRRGLHFVSDIHNAPLNRDEGGDDDYPVVGADGRLKEN